MLKVQEMPRVPVPTTGKWHAALQRDLSIEDWLPSLALRYRQEEQTSPQTAIFSKPLSAERQRACTPQTARPVILGKAKAQRLLTISGYLARRCLPTQRTARNASRPARL